MSESPDQFAYWLTQAVGLIQAVERKGIGIIQDELALALGRTSGQSSIGYWRRGFVPGDLAEVERLALLLARRGGLSERSCEQFLRSAGHPRPEVVVQKVWPTDNANSRKPPPGLAEKSRPFNAHRPITDPRQFFGRERECRRIFSGWRYSPLQDMAIVGPKRSGRTSLLHYLRAIHATPPTHLRPGQRHDWLPDAQRYRWVYVDFFDARWQTPTNLMRFIITGLGCPLPEQLSLDTFMETLGEHLPGPAIIMFDELSAGLELPGYGPAFWHSMRALATSTTQNRLAFAITALDEPQRLADAYGKMSPFFNLFATVKLGPLTETEARDLIASSPVPFAEADVAWLLAHSQGWPVVLQALCAARLEAHEDAGDDEAWQAQAMARLARYGYLLGHSLAPPPAVTG